jgi:hypothetical protein
MSAESWIAGTMAVTDPAHIGDMPTPPPGWPAMPPDVTTAVNDGAGLAGVLPVPGLGWLLKRRAPAH